MNGKGKLFTSYRVLVTRPAHQQSLFIDRCIALELIPISMPCIDILPVDVNIPAALVNNTELILFTSRNAVDFAHNRRPLPWLGKKVYALGDATARALDRLKQPLASRPMSPFTSEAFINWLSTQPPCSRALIIKGVGGRNVIEAYFNKLKTPVDILDVYKRVQPVVSDAERQRVFADQRADIVSVTSDEGLRNLVHIAGARYGNVLHRLPLIVNRDRTAALAARLGFEHTALVAHPPGDNGQIKILTEWLVDKTANRLKGPR